MCYPAFLATPPCTKPAATLQHLRDICAGLLCGPLP